MESLFIAYFNLCNEESYKAIVDDDTWHRRLGHLNKVSRKGTYHSVRKYVDLVWKEKVQNYHPRSTRIGKLIHSDVGGPIRIPTQAGERYYQTVIDD